MPRPRWRGLSPERRDEIAEAVLDEVADVGFARASINRILRTAGLSKGALYYYFDDRSDLLRTVLGRLAGQIRPDLLAPVLATETPDAFWSEIGAQYSAGLRWLAGHPRLRRLAAWAISEGAGPRGLPAETGAFVAQVSRLSARALAHGQAIGAVRDDLPTALLEQLTLSLLYAVDSWNLTQDPIAPEEAAALLVSSCKRLLSPLDESGPV